jgi:serine protease Do
VNVLTPVSPVSKPLVLLPVLLAAAVSLHAQVYPPDTSALRDYVGLVGQSFHPGVTGLVEKIKEESWDDREYLKNIDRAMKGILGSGVLVSAGTENGETYILTNYHVISGAWKPSITFISRQGEQTVYSELRFIAADAEKDLALFAFAGSEKPLRGLAFLDRPVQEGEDVYTAGFPAMPGESVWQLGRGAVSNTQVMLPKDEDEASAGEDGEGETEKSFGPFIQHTAQVDPGNSGGPLLVYDPEAPAGFAVAGINALSARWRQAANFAVPADTVRAFISEALGLDGPPARRELDKKLRSFLKIFEDDKPKTPRYEKIAAHLSLSCIGENAVYAYYEALDGGMEYTVSGIGSRPVGVLRNVISRLIQKSVSSKKLKAEITDINEETENAYTVTMAFDGKEVSTRWIQEYGQWRLDRFGDLRGDKSLAEKSEKRHNTRKKLRDEKYGFHVDGGYVYIVDRGPALFASLGNGGDEGYGLRLYYADERYWQLEMYMETLLAPLRFSVFSLALTFNIGAGFKKVPAINGSDWGIRVGMSPQLGLQFTTALIPGLYIGAAYQFNWYFKDSADSGGDTHLFIFSAGYRFPRRE